MSKWHNPTWQFPPANTTNWHGTGKPPEPHAYAVPMLNRPGPHTSVDNDPANDSAGTNDPQKFSASTSVGMIPAPHMRSDIPIPDELVPRPMLHQQPFPPAHAVYMNPAPFTGIPIAAGQYVPMQMPMYPMPPPEYNSHGQNFQIHSENWDAQAQAIKHSSVGGSDVTAEQHTPRITHDKRNSGTSTASSPMLDTAPSQDDASIPQGVAGNKNSKRSRMGCLTCRQRKKRCCENHPTCGECDRLRLKCVWPEPGTEHKNKPKEIKKQENMIEHETYGKIKVLRGIVEYRSD